MENSSQKSGFFKRVKKFFSGFLFFVATFLTRICFYFYDNAKRSPKKFTQKTFLFLLLFFIAICFFFYQKNSTVEPTNGGTLVEGLLGQPKNLNPLFSQNNEMDRTISRLIFRGLIKFDEQGRPRGDLAENWEISEDQLTYTFYLKKEIVWHDGKKFSADDVIYTIKITQSPSYESFWKESFKGVLLKKIDDYTLEIKLEQPLAPFLENLRIGILPNHLLEKITAENLILHPFNKKPIGTGIFKFEKTSEDGEKILSISLNRFAKNKDINPPHINSLVFKFYSQEHDLNIAFKEGQISSFGQILQQTSETLTGWHNFISLDWEIQTRYYAVFFNTKSENSCLTKKEIRKALYLASPKEEILNQALFKKGVIASGPINPQSWAFYEESPSPNFDIEKAKKMVKEGDCENFSLTLSFVNRLAFLKTAKILKESWEKIGVKVILQPLTSHKLVEEKIKPKKFEVLLFGQETSIDPDRYSLWHSTQIESPGLNITSIKNRFIDKTLEEGRKNADIEVRKEHYRKFQKSFQEEVPAIFLYYPRYNYIVNKKIKGVELKTLFKPEDRFNEIEKWYIKTKRVLR